MKTPRHIFVIGIIALLWNAGGAFDYVMMQTRNTQYMAQMTSEMRAYFDGFPTWVEAGWALGVWGAIAGSVLLLLRSRFAYAAFIASLVGLLANTFYGMFISPTPMTALMGPMGMWFSFAIIFVAILLVWYSGKMAARGHLR